MNKPKRLSSGAIYTTDGDMVDIDFIANGGIDQNKKFSLADLKEIIKTEFPRVRPENLRIFAHSCAGIQITKKRKGAD